jgi:hypothetical protein
VTEPRLIEDYKAVLLAEPPASLGEEVIDGLYEAYGKYLRRGLAGEEAAAAAVAEFGDPRTAVQAFSRASIAGRAARALIATGSPVGLCWAAELISGKAWDWPLPVSPPC